MLASSCYIDRINSERVIVIGVLADLSLALHYAYNVAHCVAAANIRNSTRLQHAGRACSRIDAGIVQWKD